MIMHENISLTHTVSQIKGNIISGMAGEKVMLSIKNGKYYNLGEIGGYIWNLIEESISIKQLVIPLMDKFEVEQSECESQVILFINQLLEEELIVINEAR